MTGISKEAAERAIDVVRQQDPNARRTNPISFDELCAFAHALAEPEPEKKPRMMVDECPDVPEHPGIHPERSTCVLTCREASPEEKKCGHRIYNPCPVCGKDRANHSHASCEPAEPGDEVCCGTCAPNHTVHSIVGCFLVFADGQVAANGPNWSIVHKRPDEPGDGMRHKEHPDWKLGVWAYDAASFPLVGECERDRSKLVRVICAQETT